MDPSRRIRSPLERGAVQSLEVAKESLSMRHVSGGITVNNLDPLIVQSDDSIFPQKSCASRCNL